MGYFIKSSEDREAYISQLPARVSFLNYLGYKCISIYAYELFSAHELEEKYKDEFATWLALRRMGVELWM